MPWRPDRCGTTSEALQWCTKIHPRGKLYVHWLYITYFYGMENIFWLLIMEKNILILNFWQKIWFVQWIMFAKYVKGINRNVIIFFYSITAWLKILYEILASFLDPGCLFWRPVMTAWHLIFDFLTELHPW